MNSAVWTLPLYLVYCPTSSSLTQVYRRHHLNRPPHHQCNCRSRCRCCWRLLRWARWRGLMPARVERSPRPPPVYVTSPQSYIERRFSQWPIRHVVEISQQILTSTVWRCCCCCYINVPFRFFCCRMTFPDVDIACLMSCSRCTNS